ncbi:hypothetical protein BKA62DRAFT_760566 [Auriculariales sp. MPI-PUGE-AT-0066]|nr:hypothetical protein BKA62DRAFT_760566 [Auriculariales sp. MPI-PUGE-AT-0066]
MISPRNFNTEIRAQEYRCEMRFANAYAAKGPETNDCGDSGSSGQKHGATHRRVARRKRIKQYRAWENEWLESSSSVHWIEGGMTKTRCQWDQIQERARRFKGVTSGIREAMVVRNGDRGHNAKRSDRPLLATARKTRRDDHFNAPHRCGPSL